LPTLYIRPNGPGDETGIDYQNPSSGYHWDKVCEVVKDYDTTYVSQYSSSWQRDLYALENLSQIGTINWIKVWIVITGASTSNAGKTVIKTGGTVYEGSVNYIPVTSQWYSFYTQYDVNPKTGIAWTWDDINALQAGVSIVGFYIMPYLLEYYIVYCTQVYVEIDLSPGPGYPTCVCDLAGYNFNCPCNATCYGQGCVCNATCDTQGGCKGDTSCGCNATCYQQSCNTCYNACYSQSCQCDMMKYDPGVWLFY